MTVIYCSNGFINPTAAPAHSQIVWLGQPDIRKWISLVRCLIVMVLCWRKNRVRASSIIWACQTSSDYVGFHNFFGVIRT